MDNKIYSPPKKILIFLRHAERTDKAGEKPICGEFDPEITKLGKEQAYLTGEMIVNELEKIFQNKISPKEINIRSSPYMRTIQTTSYLINGIKSKIKDNKDISLINNAYIDYGLIERLKENRKYIDGYLNFLYNKNYADIDEELKKVNFINKNESEFKIITETKDECYERCKKYLFTNIKHIIYNNNENNYKVFILVCHQGVMKSFFKLLNYEREKKNKIQVCEQFYFDISDGFEKAKIIKIIKLPQDKVNIENSIKNTYINNDSMLK